MTGEQYELPGDPDSFDVALATLNVEVAQTAERARIAGEHCAHLAVCFAEQGFSPAKNGWAAFFCQDLAMRLTCAETDPDETQRYRLVRDILVTLEAERLPVAVDVLVAYTGIMPLTLEETAQAEVKRPMYDDRNRVKEGITLEVMRLQNRLNIAASTVEARAFIHMLINDCYLLRRQTAPEDQAVRYANLFDTYISVVRSCPLDDRYLHLASRLLSKGLAGV